MRRRISYMVGLILFVSILSCGCTSLYQEPKNSVTNVEPAELTATNVSFIATLSVDNLNFLGITLNGLICNVSVSG